MPNIQDRIARARWRKWSKRELLKLAALLQSQSLSEISIQLGRSESAIRDKTREKFPELVEHHRALFPADWGQVVMPVNSRAPWSQEDRDKLREMYTTGRPMKEIIAAFGRSSASIYAQMKVMHLKERDSGSNRPWDLINKEYDDGSSIQQLMRKWHVDYYRLVRNLRNHEKRSRSQLNEEEAEIIQERYLSGCTIACIANGLCRDQGTISRFVTDKKLLTIGIDAFGELIDLASEMIEIGFNTRTIAAKLELPLSRALRIVDLAKKVEAGDED